MQATTKFLTVFIIISILTTPTLALANKCEGECFSPKEARKCLKCVKKAKKLKEIANDKEAKFNKAQGEIKTLKNELRQVERHNSQLSESVGQLKDRPDAMEFTLTIVGVLATGLAGGYLYSQAQ